MMWGKPKLEAGWRDSLSPSKGALADTSVETDRRRVTLIIGRAYSARIYDNSAVQSEVGIV